MGLEGLVAGEANEAVARPGQHRAEHVQAALLAPIDDQMLAGLWHPGPVAATAAAPVGLGRRHRPSEVACRPLVASCSGRRQQPLGADTTVGVLNPAGDQAGDPVGVATQQPRASHPGPARSLSFDDAPHCLVGDAADQSRGAVTPGLVVGVDDVHVVPHRLQ